MKQQSMDSTGDSNFRRTGACDVAADNAAPGGLTPVELLLK